MYQLRGIIKNEKQYVGVLVQNGEGVNPVTHVALDIFHNMVQSGDVMNCKPSRDNVLGIDYIGQVPMGVGSAYKKFVASLPSIQLNIIEMMDNEKVAFYYISDVRRYQNYGYMCKFEMFGDIQSLVYVENNIGFWYLQQKREKGVAHDGIHSFNVQKSCNHAFGVVPSWIFSWKDNNLGNIHYGYKTDYARYGGRTFIQLNKSVDNRNMRRQLGEFLV